MEKLWKVPAHRRAGQTSQNLMRPLTLPPACADNRKSRNEIGVFAHRVSLRQSVVDLRVNEYKSSAATKAKLLCGTLDPGQVKGTMPALLGKIDERYSATGNLRQSAVPLFQSTEF